MTLGFAMFAIGLALVVSALKDKTVAEVIQGSIGGGDVPLGTASTATGIDPSQKPPPGLAGPNALAANPELLKYLQDRAQYDFHLNITEPIGEDSGGHVENSLHKEDRAFDASGTEKNMRAFTNYVKKEFGSSITELIHNPGGSIKYGKTVPGSFWKDLWPKHKGHVHVGI